MSRIVLYDSMNNKKIKKRINKGKLVIDSYELIEEIKNDKIKILEIKKYSRLIDKIMSNSIETIIADFDSLPYEVTTPNLKKIIINCNEDDIIHGLISFYMCRNLEEITLNIGKDSYTFNTPGRDSFINLSIVYYQSEDKFNFNFDLGYENRIIDINYNLKDISEYHKIKELKDSYIVNGNLSIPSKYIVYKDSDISNSRALGYKSIEFPDTIEEIELTKDSSNLEEIVLNNFPNNMYMKCPNNIKRIIINTDKLYIFNIVGTLDTIYKYSYDDKMEIYIKSDYYYEKAIMDSNLNVTKFLTLKKLGIYSKNNYIKIPNNYGEIYVADCGDIGQEFTLDLSDYSNQALTSHIINESDNTKNMSLVLPEDIENFELNFKNIYLKNIIFKSSKTNLLDDRVGEITFEEKTKIEQFMWTEKYYILKCINSDEMVVYYIINKNKVVKEIIGKDFYNYYYLTSYVDSLADFETNEDLIIDKIFKELNLDSDNEKENYIKLYNVMNILKENKCIDENTNKEAKYLIKRLSDKKINRSE